MNIFRGNTPVTVSRVVGYDEYGQPNKSTTFTTNVIVVEFLDNVAQTPLRQEMSASHGRLDDDVAKVVLNFDPSFNIMTDDVVTLFGTTLVVDGVWPRQNAQGITRFSRVQLHRKVLAIG